MTTAINPFRNLMAAVKFLNVAYNPTKALNLSTRWYIFMKLSGTFQMKSVSLAIECFFILI